MQAGAVLAETARGLSPAVNRIVLTVLGLTSCLYAILDIKSDIIDRPGLRSDAHMLAELTGIPTLVWGAFWIALALVACGLLFRRMYAKA